MGMILKISVICFCPFEQSYTYKSMHTKVCFAYVIFEDVFCGETLYTHCGVTGFRHAAIWILKTRNKALRRMCSFEEGPRSCGAEQEMLRTPEALFESRRMWSFFTRRAPLEKGLRRRSYFQVFRIYVRYCFHFFLTFSKNPKTKNPITIYSSK